mmetsp:Transcript_29441/g.57637  ORF Transcript_29441/g.57637 Transcript_29441/m.57637 type:complete len:303 (+) Transcript_29441:742-1650(+)
MPGHVRCLCFRHCTLKSFHCRRVCIIFCLEKPFVSVIGWRKDGSPIILVAILTLATAHKATGKPNTPLFQCHFSPFCPTAVWQAVNMHGRFVYRSRKIKWHQRLIKLQVPRGRCHHYYCINASPQFFQTSPQCSEGHVRLVLSWVALLIPRAGNRHGPKLMFHNTLHTFAVAGVQHVLGSNRILLLKLGTHSECQTDAWKVVGLGETNLSTPAWFQVFEVSPQVPATELQHTMEGGTCSYGITSCRWCEQNVYLWGADIPLQEENLGVDFSIIGVWKTTPLGIVGVCFLCLRRKPLSPITPP